MRIGQSKEERSKKGNDKGNGKQPQRQQPQQQPQRQQRRQPRESQLEQEEQQWRRKPQPKWFQNILVKDSKELTDENTTNELSKVEFIQVYAPPFAEVKVERTVAGDKQTVVEQSPLWRYDKNRVDLQERGQPLVVGENQSLIITLVNPQAGVGNLHASVHIQKDQLLPSRSGSPKRRY